MVTMISAYIEKQRFFYTRAYIIMLAMVLFCGVAMGQRTDQQHVSVGGNVFGGGKSADVKGSSTVLVDQDGAIIGTKTSGTLVVETGDVYGGGALAKVNVTATTTSNTTTYSQTTGKSTQVTMRKGTVYGNLFGGGLGVRPDGDEGTPADVYGPVTVTVNGGKVEGSVFGCNNLYGSPQDTVIVNVLKDGENVVMSINNVYGGGNLAAYTAPAATSTYPKLHNYPEVNIKHGTVGGSVFGGGYGASAEVTGNPQVFIGDENTEHTAKVNGNVYGGGDEAAVTGYTLVTVQNAHSQVAQDVYGGGNQADVLGSDTVNIINGTIGQDVYGGGALANVGTSNSDNTVVNVLGGIVSGNVYGGGLGRKASQGVEPIAAAVNGVVTVNIGAGTEGADGFAETVSGEATINGSVFGCNNTNGSPQDNVIVNIWKTAHTIGDDGNSVSGTGYALSQVFGGGNQANYEPASADKKATVHVWTCDNTIEYIYGGGNAADLGTSTVNSATNVVIDGGRIEWVFGGGNGYSATGNHTDPSAPNYNPGANINGNTQVTYHAGNITYVFGGSNQWGNVSGSKTVDILSDGTCTYDNHITELYGGNNEAPSTGDISLTMGCPEHLCDIGTVYGGSRNANIEGNVTLTIIGGQYNQVFGGNNIGGTITGDVTLNLYGGTINSAYGGNNASGRINGKIIVNVLDDMSKDNDDNWTCPLILHNVYGGGYDAPYNPSTDAALAGSYPEVNIIHGTVSTKEGAAPGTTGNVFGGGYGTTAVVQHKPKVRVGYDATMSDYIFENYPVEPDNRTAIVENNVFGGGDQAAVAGSTSVTLQHDNSSVARLFGGGNLASVGNVTLNVIGGAVSAGVYGGCNESGTVGGDIAPYTTTLNNTTNTYSQPNTAIAAINYDGDVVVDVVGGTIGGTTRANIHGGGYGHQTSTNGDVTVTFGAQNTEHSDLPTLTGDLYGGSALGNVGATGSTTTVNVINGKIIGDVYGGGLGDNDYAAAINGDVAVYIGKTMGTTPTLYNTALLATYNDGAKGGNVFGCNNANGAPTGNVQVNINGNVTKNVFGGGNLAAYTGTPDVKIIAGTVSGSVFGGGNEAGVGGGDVTMTGGTVLTGLYGGCNTSGVVGGDITVDVTGGTIGTDDTNSDDGVFGGGFGNGTSTTGDVTVTIDGGDVNVYGDVYGGSAKGSVNASGKTTNVTLTSGIIHGDLYGGGLGDDTYAAAVNGAVLVTVNGGTVNDVFGCNNENGAPQSTVQVDIEQTGSNMSVNNVFGGGNLAVYSGNPKVFINNGTVSGNVYGGGNGDPADNTQTKGSTGVPTVTVGDLTNDNYQAIVLGDVYGGGNAAKVTGTNMADSIYVQKCNTQINYVYGGGNAANVPATFVKVMGGTIDTIFGGGHGDNTPGHLVAANVNGNDTISITGGTIKKVFAGSNLNGSITGRMALNIDKGSNGCDMKIGEAYGGGNMASGKAGAITVGCTGTWTDSHNTHNSTTNRIGYELEGIGTVYGGANQANITGDITLNITSGIVENVFGGNNNSGEIGGNITVNIEKDNSATCAQHWYVGNVYGGGNQAKYQPTTPGAYPAVNIKNGTVSQNVFGGGLGATAKVYSNPVVTVGDVNPDHSAYQAVVLGNVHGGGSAAMVGDGGETPSICNTTVTLQKANSSVAKLFGGGMAAGVTGTTTVNVNNGTVSAGAYGGCDASGEVGGNIAVNVTGGTVGTNDDVSEDGIFGGGFGNGTSTSGNVTVAISGGDVYGDVYGGSAKGSVNDASSDQTIVTLTIGTIHGDLYGGGLGDADYAAAVNGAVKVNVNGGTVTNVFGCNNVNGAPQSTVQVNIHETTENTMYVTNVYGGGNQAAYSGSPVVNIQAGTVSRNVYGGGNNITTENAGILNSDVEMTGGIVLGGIYGGCNLNGYVTGNSVVNILGGTVGSSSQLDANTVANVFGGGLGADTKVSGNVTVNIGNTSTGPTLYGDVYGGSALGSVNSVSSNTTTVNILNGTLVAKRISETLTNGQVIYYYTGGNVYGGGLGQKQIGDDPTTAIAAVVKGVVTVNIGSGTVETSDQYEGYTTTANSGNATIGGNVYGCNNANGSPEQDVTVNVYATAHTTENQYTGTGYAIANVFGGGNEADYTATDKTAKVNIYGCDNTIERTFGGGNAAAAPHVETFIQGGRFYQVFGGGNGERGSQYGADINAGIDLNIHGGNVGQFYGASNQNGLITGAINVNVDNNGPCTDSLIIDEFFCGGNFADISGNLETTISCSEGMMVNSLYGGCNQANITGNVVLNLEGGTYKNVYGGSKGDLASLGSGHIDKQANIGGNVTLNLHGGKIDNVFGGSKINGNIEGTITVNVLDKENSVCPLVITNIYGGSDLTHYQPDNANAIISPVVNVVHASRGIAGNVYGGSKGAEGATGNAVTKVTANPLVNIGYESGMTGLPETTAYDPDSYSRKTTIQCNVFGGGDAAKVVGNTEIHLNKGTKVIGNVYGGGNMGEVDGDTKVIVNGKRQE